MAQFKKITAGGSKPIIDVEKLPSLGEGYVLCNGVKNTLSVDGRTVTINIIEAETIESITNPLPGADTATLTSNTYHLATPVRIPDEVIDMVNADAVGAGMPAPFTKPFYTRFVSYMGQDVGVGLGMFAPAFMIVGQFLGALPVEISDTDLATETDIVYLVNEPAEEFDKNVFYRVIGGEPEIIEAGICQAGDWVEATMLNTVDELPTSLPDGLYLYYVKTGKGTYNGEEYTDQHWWYAICYEGELSTAIYPDPNSTDYDKLTVIEIHDKSSATITDPQTIYLYTKMSEPKEPALYHFVEGKFKLVSSKPIVDVEKLPSLGGGYTLFNGQKNCIIVEGTTIPFKIISAESLESITSPEIFMDEANMTMIAYCLANPVTFTFEDFCTILGGDSTSSSQEEIEAIVGTTLPYSTHYVVYDPGMFVPSPAFMPATVIFSEMTSDLGLGVAEVADASLATESNILYFVAPAEADEFDENIFYRVPEQLTRAYVTITVPGETIEQDANVYDTYEEFPTECSGEESEIFLYTKTAHDGTHWYQWINKAASGEEAVYEIIKVSDNIAAGGLLEVHDPSLVTEENIWYLVSIFEEPKLYYFINGEFKAVGEGSGGGNYVLELSVELSNNNTVTGTLTNEQYQAVVDNFPNVVVNCSGTLVANPMLSQNGVFTFTNTRVTSEMANGKDFFITTIYITDGQFSVITDSFYVELGTNVEANPSTTATAYELTSLRVYGTTYTIPKGVSVNANPTLSGSETELTGLEVDGTKYKIPEGITETRVNELIEAAINSVLDGEY